MSSKNILLFGAGKSATVLIDYLINEASSEQWTITIADANRDLIEQKTKNHPLTKSVSLDITDNEIRQSLIEKSDIVISMMPPALHILIAKDCIKYSKSLLTASYADDQIMSLNEEVASKGLIFLCEMGLDPGIDHMSAMQIIDEIKSFGGKITSFKSHCGGLVAPESDDNPWRYKISWNPRNVVLAGKAGAIFKEDGEIKEENYKTLFNSDRDVVLENEGNLRFSFYPNRNSLSYIPLYKLHETETFVRTTLRYPEFMQGWKHVINLNLTDETPSYDSNGKSLKDFYHQILQRNAPALMTDNSNETINFINQLEFLGLNDAETIINKGFCSNADVLQFSLEKKLVLHPGDKDMIVMLHEFEYVLNEEKHAVNSSLLVKGDDHLRTAMAKTVGLPLGIAAKMILNGTINLSGIHIPIVKEIYEPVLEELTKHGVVFKESGN